VNAIIKNIDVHILDKLSLYSSVVIPKKSGVKL
jgi:hypothetical protein